MQKPEKTFCDHFQINSNFGQTNLRVIVNIGHDFFFEGFRSETVNNMYTINSVLPADTRNYRSYEALYFQMGQNHSQAKGALKLKQVTYTDRVNKMFSLYIIFKTIVEEFGLRDNIYSYSIILTVLCVPIIVLLVLLTRLARFLRKMCAAKN